jgi:hypothetical protein
MRSELAEPSPAEVKRSDRLMGGYILFVAVRCTLQYVLLPFVLPFVGLSNSISVGISAAIDVFALGMISYNIRRLWSTSWRWRYLALSVIMVGILSVFLVNDFRFFLGS